MKNIFFLILLLFNEMLLNATAQVDTAWTRRFSGTAINDDITTALAVYQSGNIYISGSCWDTNATTMMEKIVAIKYNSYGDTMWVAKYGSPYGNKRGQDIAVDNGGNVFVTGWASSTIYGFQYITIKYDSSGQEKWEAIYDNGGDDQSFAIELDGQGNIYVTGLSSGGYSGYDYATIKYNSSGQQQWVARYTNSLNAYDIPTSIAVDDVGNVYVTGTSYDSTTKFDILTVKYNSLGQQQWVRRYDEPYLAGSRDDCAYAIAVDKLGDIVVTGGVQGFGSLGLPPESYQDCITIKYNSNGDTLWVRKYDRGFGQDWANDLVLDGMNNISITGTTQGPGSPDYLTIKYSTDGQLLWDKFYNGLSLNSEDKAKSIAIDKSGNIYLTGKSGIKGATVKYNPDGEEQWSIQYSDTNYPVAVGVDEQNNVFVTGQIRGDNSYLDFLTIKYIQDSTSSMFYDQKILTEYSLFQNYPNPFNPNTTISWQSPLGSHQTLKVFDVLGIEIATLVDGYKPAGKHEVEWNASHFASGVYFYKLKSIDRTTGSGQSFIQTKKMILIK